MSSKKSIEQNIQLCLKLKKKQINKNPHQFMKQGKIIDKVYQILRATEKQHARLKCPAKIHKKITSPKFSFDNW